MYAILNNSLKDGDGFITTEELGIVMRSLGQFASEEELKEMLKEVDINKDGLFSLDEFVEIVRSYPVNAVSWEHYVRN